MNTVPFICVKGPTASGPYSSVLHYSDTGKPLFSFSVLGTGKPLIQFFIIVTTENHSTALILSGD